MGRSCPTCGGGTNRRMKICLFPPFLKGGLRGIFRVEGHVPPTGRSDPLLRNIFIRPYIKAISVRPHVSVKVSIQVYRGARIDAG